MGFNSGFKGLSTSFHHGNTDEQYLCFGQYCSIDLSQNKSYFYLAPIRILAKSLCKTVQVRRTHMQWNRDLKISHNYNFDAPELSVELAATEDKCQAFTLHLQRTFDGPAVSTLAVKRTSTSALLKLCASTY